MFFTFGLALLAAFSFFLTLGFGVYDISLMHSWEVFIGHLTDNITDLDGDSYIWGEYIGRVPRAIGAIFVGAALSVAGAVMQTDFKNPLAEPYTMGIASGAFLGAVLFLVNGISIVPFADDDLALVLNSFVMSLAPTAIIVAVGFFKKMTPTMMILTGIAVMFLFSSVCQLILVTAPSESLSDAYSWRVGSLSRITWDNLPYIVSVPSILMAITYLFSGKLNVLYSGDRSAQTLGENAGNIRIITLILVSLLTASVVCFVGTIGFIGLVGPHVARIFVGSNNRYLLPASASFGAAFIILADTLAKISGPNGLPVGVISSMIGGPLFIWILVRQRRSAWA